VAERGGEIVGALIAAWDGAPAARVHTLNRPPTKAEIRNVEGLPVTSPERTIVDSLEAGVQPEQVEMAIGQALERGLTTPRRLTEAASGRSARVHRFMVGAVSRPPDDGAIRDPL